MLACTRLALHKGKEMSEGLTINQLAERNALLVTENAALQQKLDAANKELARYSMSAGQADQFAAEAKAVRKALGYADNAEDVAPVDLLEKIAGLRAEGMEMFADISDALAEEEYGDDWRSSEFIRYSAMKARFYAAQLRAETDTTPSRYESLAGGK